MIKLDDAWLAERGLEDLNAQAKTSLLGYVYRTLETQLGERIAEGLSDEQLWEFDAAMDEGEAPALEWLRTNVPNYQQITSDVLNELGDELRHRAPEILARFGQ